MIVDTGILDKLIVGRVEPHIYAFSTQTVPNYLKVGDTYRPLEQRLNEWRKHFPDLVERFSVVAKVDDATFFRDFSIHNFLEREKKLNRLQPDTIENLPYYSKEFFENATVDDVKDALTDIKSAFQSNHNKYQFYSFDESRVPLTYRYRDEETFPPRKNQQEVIDRYKAAVAEGRKNLLMYAVMRFGKSFTSMCCAAETGANLVVVVSAKGDVKEEWKYAVESHVRFGEYEFMDDTSLLKSKKALSNMLKTKKVVLFLTLQNLMGKKIKTKHKEVFERTIDLLIVDESHYGARAEEYGKVLAVTKTQWKQECADADLADEYEDNEALKALKANVRLHLSGTPYRILMGSEFQPEDIIGFCQYTDIVNIQEKWDQDHLLEDNVKEWDNPYFGFPQMVRFAFNPNESSIKKMEELEKSGVTNAFSELFRPLSISKDTSPNHGHRIFKHEQEILDLLEVIDGSKQDENVLGFLDYDKIKEGKMCRHIVCVLPYRASCDALENLITCNKDKFRNLGDYQIVNISGVENEQAYENTSSVKEKIRSCEAEGKKTLTLTVNRMLTGSTVEQWDTMLFLKECASPQEYDQAIFRLQNQYVRKYIYAKNEVVKYNMKPQTLLIDFDPNRMFRLQERKSFVCNMNMDKSGNSKLEERIKEELRISPIIILNKNKLQEVVATDILDAVREYSAKRSLKDEAMEIPIDYSLFTDPTILREIEALSPIDSSKGLDIKPNQGEEDNMDVPTDGGESGEPADNTFDDQQPDAQENTEKELLGKKLATYYAQILFFAFLTNSNVKSLDEVIDAINLNADNKRIARNVGLKLSILKIFRHKFNSVAMNLLDYSIQNLNSKGQDKDLEPQERVEAAMRKFGKLSPSEVVTPMHMAEKMVNILSESDISEHTKILDLGSKHGEFASALYARFGNKVKDHIYSIPTSSLAYEFTRKVYALLGLPVENIFSDFIAYDLIDDTKNEMIIQELQDMKFDVIIGNPPYQTDTKDTSDKPIYYKFVDVAYSLSPKVCLITPARFLFNAGKTPEQWNKKMLNNEHISVEYYNPKSADVFPDVLLKGGVAVTYKDDDKNFGVIGLYTHYAELNSILKKVINMDNFESLTDSIYLQNKFCLDVLYQDYPDYKNFIGSSGREKRLTTNIFSLLDLFKKDRESDTQVEIIGLINNVRCTRYIEPKYILEHQNLFKYKVLLPKTNNTGQLGEVLSNPLVAGPGIGYTQSFIAIGDFETVDEAANALKYIKTKFARTLLGTLKVTQDTNKGTWQNVPLQDFTGNSDIDWNQSIDEIDEQLYEKYGLNDKEITFIKSRIQEMV